MQTSDTGLVGSPRSEVNVRAAGVALLGLVGGIVLGIALSEVIAIIGVIGFDRALGVKYLPVGTGLIGAALAVLATRWEGRR